MNIEATRSGDVLIRLTVEESEEMICNHGNSPLTLDWDSEERKVLQAVIETAKILKVILA